MATAGVVNKNKSAAIMIRIMIAKMKQEFIIEEE